eukprot:TRINITY_DN23563_c0_g2_i1.p1 TRINITY_DN23563_c0_g2~~TRINITY_DN23563_c0_g2_i1.p1  ORF type:complete len:317 (+),score=64.57 TRINITY_DN23563_c0_g2_i1:59-1009(+)
MALTFRGPSGASYSFDIRKREEKYRVQALNQQDLDRNFCLAASSLFRWMQAARMDLPWMQAGYRAFCEVEPRTTRRLLVASQLLRLSRPGALAEAADKEVVTEVEVGDIGRTSLEFRYRVLLGGAQVASGCTVMITMASVPGRFATAPVPEDVRALASKEQGADHKFLRDTLAAVPAQAPEATSTAVEFHTTEVLVRYSDEDVNAHANHSAQARFFEDAKETIANDPAAPAALRAVASQHLEAIAVAYTAEVHAGDRLEVRVAAAAASETSALDVWTVRLRPKPGIVARGRLLCGGGLPEAASHRRLRQSTAASRL